MDEQYQIEIPQSFMALYSRNGRPNETRRTIEQRYDLCEDLAVQTADVCHTLQFKDDLSEREVLSRCLVSLRASGAVTPPESVWVICRVAELLQWALPDLPDPDAAGDPAGP
ncbi:MAG: ATPase with chaperone activity [Burkholderiaceae bacterium]